MLIALMVAFQATDASLRKKQQVRHLAADGNATLQNASSNVSAVLSLSAAAKSALHALFQVLAEEAMHVEPLAAFKPKCLAHVEKLIHSIDRSYTDEQLQTVLENECKLAQEFPNSQKSGYNSHDKCMEFAKKLATARDHELKTGETQQYAKFCEEYHHHLENDPVVPPAKLNATNCTKAAAPRTAPAATAKPAAKESPAKDKAHGASVGAYALLAIWAAATSLA